MRRFSVSPRALAGTGAVATQFIAVLAFFAIAGTAHAEPRTVTLEQAYAAALESHEGVKLAVEGVGLAETTLDKSTSRMLPTLTAEGGFTRYSEQKRTSSGVLLQPDDATRFDVKVTQPLYTGGREWATRRQAKLNIERSREELDARREDVMRLTARAYLGALKAEKDIEIKKAALARANERLKVASARLKVGDVTRSAVLRAEAEAAGAEAGLIRSESELVDANDLLKRVIGLTDEIKLVEPKLRSDTLPVGATLKTAYERRKDYRQKVLEEKAAGEGITYAKGNFKPQLKLEGLYSWKEQNPQTTFFQQDSMSASVVLTYPIFEGGLRVAELSEARSRFREAELKRLSLKRDIEYEVRSAFNSKNATEALINSYQKQLAFAVEDYNMVFEQYKHGVATTVDVLDADAILVSAQRSLMNAKYDLYLALVEISYKTGTLAADETKGSGAVIQ